MCLLRRCWDGLTAIPIFLGTSEIGDAAKSIQVEVITCAGEFVPCWLQEIAPLMAPAILTIGAIGIPMFIYIASRAEQRRRTALDLAKSLYTSAEITSRMEKLYRKRGYMTNTLEMRAHRLWRIRTRDHSKRLSLILLWS